MFAGGEEEGRVVKRPRAPSAPDPDVDAASNDGDQALDERNGLPKQPSVPPGFLSPSVKEYLELGKSIPGLYLRSSDCLLVNIFTIQHIV